MVSMLFNVFHLMWRRPRSVQAARCILQATRGTFDT